MPLWRNWQTHLTQNQADNTVPVRVRPAALKRPGSSFEDSGFFLHNNPAYDHSQSLTGIFSSAVQPSFPILWNYLKPNAVRLTHTSTIFLPVWLNDSFPAFPNKKTRCSHIRFFVIRNTCDSPIDLIFLNKYTVHKHLPVSVFHSESEASDRLHGTYSNLNLQSILLFVAWNNSCLPS